MERICGLLSVGKESATVAYTLLAKQLKGGDEATHRELSTPVVLSKVCNAMARDLAGIGSSSSTAAGSSSQPQSGTGSEASAAGDGSSLRVQKECIRALGYLLHASDIAALLTPAQCAALLGPLCTAISSPTASKGIVCLSVWCAAVQLLPTPRIPVDLALAVCGVLEPKARFSDSETLEAEALGALGKLLGRLQEPLSRHCGVWVPLVCRRLVHTSKHIRERVTQVVCVVLQNFVPVPPQLSAALHSELSGGLLDQLDAFFTATSPQELEEHDSYCVRIWGFLIGMLGAQVFHGPVANRMLKFAERFFVHPLPKIRAQSFESWAFIMQQYSREVWQTVSLTSKSLLLISSLLRRGRGPNHSNFSLSCLRRLSTSLRAKKPILACWMQDSLPGLRFFPECLGRKDSLLGLTSQCPLCLAKFFRKKARHCRSS